MKKNKFSVITLITILLFFISAVSVEYQLISSLVHQSVDVDWSILICTLDEREQSFQRLYKKLLQQISTCGLSDRIEVIYCKDNREYSIGHKRNALLKASKGKYINFLDDDDDVHNDYISMIHSRLMNDPDCVSLVGTLTVNGKYPRTFIHSIQYDRYFEKDKIYYRPPNHLNTIRRSIAIQFKFPEINNGEDTNWAMQTARSGLLKKEEVITEPYYFYLVSSKLGKQRQFSLEKHLSRLHQFAASAYSTRATIYNTFQLAVTCIEQSIPGDFVECGVANGSQVAAMAYACQEFNCEKKVHLFDSFEGIPLAGPEDGQQPGIGAIQHDVSKPLEERLVSSGISICSLENVQRNLKNWGLDSRYFVYHKGWFQHTLPIDAQKISSISFLRLDGDLYESTKVCLEYLYPKVSKGGYVVIDDYGSLTGCKKAVDDYLEKHSIKVEIKVIEGGMGPVYWQVQ